MTAFSAVCYLGVLIVTCAIILSRNPGVRGANHCPHKEAIRISKAATTRNNPARKPERESYQGFLIIKCYNPFGAPYFTILNEGTNVHVHARTIRIARSICDEAEFFRLFGFFRTNQIDMRNRASKLAIRTTRAKERR